MARSNMGPLEELSQDMERVFDSLLGRRVGTILRGSSEDRFVPSLDVLESESDLEVSIDLPGVQPDDVKVELHDGKLTISGTRKHASEDSSKNHHRLERSTGNFSRSVTLPGDVDIDAIDARYELGVLHVKLPKVAKKQPRKIQIRTN